MSTRFIYQKMEYILLMKFLLNTLKNNYFLANFFFITPKYRKFAKR